MIDFYENPIGEEKGKEPSDYFEKLKNDQR